MENYTNLNKDQKMTFWSEHINSWLKSGLSQKKYCEQKDLSYWSFRTWHDKTRSVKSESKFIRLNTPFPKENHTSKISIILSGILRIEFEENISDEALRKIFKAAEVFND